MKRLALVACLFMLPSLASADMPGQDFCLAVKGLENHLACYPSVVLADFPQDLVKDTFRNAVAGLGFDAANALYPQPISPQDTKQRDLGLKLMEIYQQTAFPDFGDVITKDTKAVGYCSSSVGQGIVSPFDPWDSKPTGKGRCEDYMIIYLRPAGK